MEKLTTRVTLVPKGEPLFCEEGWEIEIDDEAGGEFVKVRCNASGYGQIAINPWEWDDLKSSIEEMVKSCRG